VIALQTKIRVSFYADVDEKKMNDVFKGFNKCGAEIITNEFPELLNVGSFDVEVLSKKEE